jgi:hypothetical protein
LRTAITRFFRETHRIADRKGTEGLAQHTIAVEIDQAAI